MYYESGRRYIYNLIVKQYIKLQGFNFDDLSDECYSSMCNELVNLSDEDLINQLGRIYEISLK